MEIGQVFQHSYSSYLFYCSLLMKPICVFNIQFVHSAL